MKCKKRTIFLAIVLLGVVATSLAAPATKPTTRPTTLPADQMLTRLLRPGAATAQPLEPVQYAPGLDQTTGKPAAPMARDEAHNLTNSRRFMSFSFTLWA